MANGLIIAAPRSGSGKTLITLGLLAALKRRGIAVAPAKTGPDYIDRAILARVAGAEAINLDPWAMPAAQLQSLAADHGAGADLLLIEGVMGLFDGAADGTGSTADLAATLGLPVILVVDADKQSQSIAAQVFGFARFRSDIEVVGVIVNRVASTRHERMLFAALEPSGIPILGALPRRNTLHLPARHLGLVMPNEVAGFDAVVATAAELIEEHLNLDLLLALSSKVPNSLPPFAGISPLGQRISIARDDAFSFLYPHLLTSWHAQGAELTFFSPLADQSAQMDSDAVFLPGGYPELHGEALASATHFAAGMTAARDRGALIYGECGGYMTLGQSLSDASGITHKMLGLLPISTDISRPKRTLGYRRLTHSSPLPWPENLRGHEFHYSAGSTGTPLFATSDALGTQLPPLGAVAGRVMGSYAHVIAVA